MKILFLDQSSKLGGAELSLSDVAKPYRNDCLVGIFADGPFREFLEKAQIPVQVLTNQPIQISRDSHFIQSISRLGSLIPLIARVTKIARDYDIIYANTQKALVVGALASFLSRRPLVYHLRDILSTDHFSRTNCWIAVTLANRFASLVIANSKATQSAFIEAGGRPEITTVVYNGFDPENYQSQPSSLSHLKQQLGIHNQYVVGHFSRLSPWKGQHILIEALTHCPEDVTTILVGDPLFGEEEYAEQLHQQVADLGLENRVQFLGFRSDIPSLMACCDLIAHTSISPEPFGRVIIEAMFCNRPVVAAAAGGVVELVESGRTGWLVKPGDVKELADVITLCRRNPKLAIETASQAQQHLQMSGRFHLSKTNQQIAHLLRQLMKETPYTLDPSSERS
ncbi:MAG: glycosyltransferase [Leptolyngbyaceae cyanobacterium MO_188.B28]|nr:glycosyltransferase [Leptolyngbyaceae cyanobacterium MO_188.B28]